MNFDIFLAYICGVFLITALTNECGPFHFALPSDALFHISSHDSHLHTKISPSQLSFMQVSISLIFDPTYHY